MANAYYIKVMEDPWSRHSTRKYSRHNMHSLVGKVFQVEDPIPRDVEMVSIVDGSISKQRCYLIERSEFLRKAPEFEDTVIGESGAGKYVSIPVEFAVDWLPDGRFVNGKSVGLEESFRKSRRWREEAEKMGLSSNPFTIKSKWV